MYRELQGTRRHTSNLKDIIIRVRLKLSTAPEKTYRRFLLGIASEEEESRAEEAILTGRVDASFLHDLEDEIIDDYLLGNITSDERDGFTEKFLAMEERRKRVAFAAWLIEYARKNSAEEPSVEPTSARARDFLGLFSWKTAALFATAACVLFAILAGNEHFKLRRQIQLASPMRNERAGALDRVSGKIEELSQADLLRSESSSPSDSASDHLLVAQGAKPNNKSALVSIPDLTALLMPTIEFAASTRSVYPDFGTNSCQGAVRANRIEIAFAFSRQIPRSHPSSKRSAALGAGVSRVCPAGGAAEHHRFAVIDLTDRPLSFSG